jgi:hypothetical protein
MPACSEFGDGTTIVEGPTQSYARAHVLVRGSRGKGAAASKMYTTFAKTSDYFSEERPFVVLIGKKGVIRALQDLDSLLRAVCCFFSHAHLRFSQPTDLRFGCCRRDIT